MPTFTLAYAHIEAERRLRLLTASRVAAAWLALASYDEDDVPGFLTAVTPLILAAQRQSIALTNAYLARAAGERPFALDLAQLTGPALRAGADPGDVYRRAFVTTWTALKAGQAYAAATKAGLERATATAEMDVQLAMRATVRDVTEKSTRIVGYRRVPNPGACVLCLKAATQRYHGGELMPIHNRCGCGVAPIVGDRDPGQVILPKFADDSATPAVEQHGELGPVLVAAGQTFTEI